MFRQSGVAVSFGNLAREHSAYRAVGVGYGIIQGNLLPVLDGRHSMQDNVLIFYMSGQMHLFRRMPDGICRRLCRDVQQFGEIEQCVFAGC